MSQRHLSPEDVIGQMSCDEVQELLAHLTLESTREAAVRFKRLVRQLGQFEAAIEMIGGPPSMKDAA